MICITGYESHRQIQGRANILCFLDWLAQEVHNLIVAYRRSGAELVTIQECEQVMSMIDDTRKQVSKFAKQTTTEYGIELCQELGVDLQIKPSFRTNITRRQDGYGRDSRGWGDSRQSGYRQDGYRGGYSQGNYGQGNYGQGSYGRGNYGQGNAGNSQGTQQWGPQWRDDFDF